MLDTGDAYLKNLEDAANAPARRADGGDHARRARRHRLGRRERRPRRPAAAAGAARAPRGRRRGCRCSRRTSPTPRGRAPSRAGSSARPAATASGSSGSPGPRPGPSRRRGPARRSPRRTRSRPRAAPSPSCAAPARLVVALSQLGLEEDARLAREVPGIDVILGGHSRALTPVPRVEGATLIVHAGAKGMRLGRLALEIAPGAAGPWVSRPDAQGRRAEGLRLEHRAARRRHPRPPGRSPRCSSATARSCARATSPSRRPRPRRRPPPSRRTSARRPAAPATRRSCASGRPAGTRAPWRRSTRKRQELNPECVRCHVTAFGEPGGYLPGAARRDRPRERPVRGLPRLRARAPGQGEDPRQRPRGGLPPLPHRGEQPDLRVRALPEEARRPRRSATSPAAPPPRPHPGRRPPPPCERGAGGIESRSQAPKPPRSPFARGG